jgi:hypothetical protein
MMQVASELCTRITIEEPNFILWQDLTSFIERSFYELYPGQSLELAPHIELIASMLDAVRRGQIKRLIINMPPRHLKSRCVSVAFVAWVELPQALEVVSGMSAAAEAPGNRGHYLI